MKNTCPFTRFREIEKVVKSSDAFSTKGGFSHVRHSLGLFQQLGLRHAWPLLKNARIILKEIRSSNLGKHGRFPELPASESVRYRIPISNFLQRRKWDDVGEIVNRHLEGLRKRGLICLCKDLIEPCNEEVALKLMGIPPSNWNAYKHPNYDFVFSSNEDAVHGMVSRIRARHLLEKEVARQRKFPEKDGLIEFLINYEKKGETFSNTEIAGSVWMVLGAHLPIRYFLSNALNFFAKETSAREEFRKNPARRSPILEELLRFFTPGLQTQRIATHDFCVENRNIKKDDIITLHWGKGNLDESVFENPEEINFDREDKEHLAFGIGARYCLGAGFSRSFSELFLLRFFEEFPGYRIHSSESVKLQTTFNGFERLPADLIPKLLEHPAEQKDALF